VLIVFTLPVHRFLQETKERQPSSFGLSRSTSPDDGDWTLEGESVYNKDASSSMVEVSNIVVLLIGNH